MLYIYKKLMQNFGYRKYLWIAAIYYSLAEGTFVDWQLYTASYLGSMLLADKILTDC